MKFVVMRKGAFILDFNPLCKEYSWRNFDVVEGGLEISEIELLLYYCVYIRTYTLRKDLKPLVPWLWFKYYYRCSFTRLVLALNCTRRLIYLQAKKPIKNLTLLVSIYIYIYIERERGGGEGNDSFQQNRNFVNSFLSSPEIQIVRSQQTKTIFKWGCKIPKLRVIRRKSIVFLNQKEPRNTSSNHAIPKN